MTSELRERLAEFMSGKDLAEDVRQYFIPDFSNWKDHQFEAAFARLLTDPRAEERWK